jgi:hypothetical protein
MKRLAGSALTVLLIFAILVLAMWLTGRNVYAINQPITATPEDCGADWRIGVIGQYYHACIAPYGGSYGAGSKANRFFPALGNHDWYTPGAQPYFDYFTLPGNERYYAVRRGPIEFFILDTDPHEPDGYGVDSAQARWLQQQLAASDAPWKIVVLHYPPYSSSARHGSDRKVQWPFAEWGHPLSSPGTIICTSACRKTAFRIL